MTGYVMPSRLGLAYRVTRNTIRGQGMCRAHGRLGCAARTMAGMNSNDSEAVAARQSSAFRRWLPVAAIAALMALIFAMGWHRLISFEMVGRNYDAMRAFIAENGVLAVLAYMAIYTASVALSLPGALILTLTGGLLFGWAVGAAATVVAATIGASIVFLIAKTSFGETLAARAGPWIENLRDGFRANALSYLLFLRLVPAFPFFVVNLVPALLGVPLRTFVIGTFFGIIPGTVAFCVAGAGLGSVIEAQNASQRACLDANGGNGTVCPYVIDTSALVTRELLIAFAVLGCVALIPVVLNKLRGQKKNDSGGSFDA